MSRGAPQELLAHHAARLFHGGYAKVVLVSGKFSYRRQSFAEEWKAHQGKEGTGPDGDDGGRPASYQTEAAWLKALMVREGVPESAIWTEEESTNTFENARFCRKLLESKGNPTAHHPAVHPGFSCKKGEDDLSVRICGAKDLRVFGGHPGDRQRDMDGRRRRALIR